MLVLELDRGDIVEVIVNGVVVAEVCPTKGKNLKMGFRGPASFRRKNAKVQQPKVEGVRDA